MIFAEIRGVITGECEIVVGIHSIFKKDIKSSELDKYNHYKILNIHAEHYYDISELPWVAIYLEDASVTVGMPASVYEHKYQSNSASSFIMSNNDRSK